jgi:hypothetical protein
MADSIETHYVKGGFATVPDLVLVETKTTRTVFRPAVHGGGVRGQVIRQKVGKDGKWADINEVDFRSIPADSGVSVDLDTAGTKLLYDNLTNLYKVQDNGIEFGDQKYVVAKEGEVLIVDDASKKKAIQEILDQGYSEEFWEALAQKNPDLATRLAVAQVQVDRQQIIKQFETAMTEHADEESFWQSFFEANPWILETAFSASVFMLGGETYLGGKQPIGRQGVGGVATDYLFGDESTKSFAVVDIKKPKAGLVGPCYRGEAGSGLDNETYSMHNELSGGIVQVRNQMTVAIEHFQSVLGVGYKDKINRVHPRGVLITGCLKDLSQREKDSLNQFRHGLYSLTVITFDELLNRLKKLYGLEYENTDTSASQPTEPEPADQPINLDDMPF